MLQNFATFDSAMLQNFALVDSGYIYRDAGL
jgi:hypothetical protein